MRILLLLLFIFSLACSHQPNAVDTLKVGAAAAAVNPEPEELDRALSILQFTSPAGQPIATLTNFACHPTFMDAASDQVSADFVGGLYKTLDTSIGGVNLY